MDRERRLQAKMGGRRPHAPVQFACDLSFHQNVPQNHNHQQRVGAALLELFDALDQKPTKAQAFKMSSQGWSEIAQQ